MKIVRWLLSHIILILLIVVVIYGYMFWGKLTDADTPGGKAVAYLSDKFAPVEKFVNETKAKQSRLSEDQSIEGNTLEDDEQNIATEMNATGETVANDIESSVLDRSSEVSANNTQFLTQEDDEQNIATETNATGEPVANNIESSVLDRRSEFSVNNTQFTTQKDDKQNIVTEKDATSEPVANNIGSSMLDRQSQVSVDNTQFTNGDKSSSASAANKKKDIIKDTFVTPDVEARLNAVTSVTASSDVNSALPKTRSQKEVAINDTGASTVAVDRSKNVYVSPDVEAQLNKVNNDGAIVDTSNMQPLTNQPSDTSVNDEPSTIGDSVASAGASAVEMVKDFFVSPKAEVQPVDADEAAGVVAAASQQGVDEKKIDVKASWIMARKSYYKRNYEMSEKSYQQVIDNTEDNYDAYGELGNVYFNQGKDKQAASAYYEAAAIFVRTGHLPRAKSLIGLLRRLDKSKADELQKLIDSTAS